MHAQARKALQQDLLVQLRPGWQGAAIHVSQHLHLEGLLLLWELHSTCMLKVPCPGLV